MLCDKLKCKNKLIKIYIEKAQIGKILKIGNATMLMLYNYNAILYNPDAVSSVLCCEKMLGIY